MSSPSMYESFPPAMRSPDRQILTWALSAAVDEAIARQHDWWENYYANLINPDTIAPELLDFVFVLPCSPWRGLWNPDWTEQAKRDLLTRTNDIFAQRYTPQVLDLLFSCFGLPARVRYKTGWILGAPGIGTPLPATIGVGLNDVEIVAANYIKAGTIEYGLVQWCLKEFYLPFTVPIVYF